MYVKDRVPDEKLTELRSGDLFMPNKDYIQEPAIFMGFNWEKHTRTLLGGETEHGWIVYPYVYVAGTPHGQSMRYLEDAKIIKRLEGEQLEPPLPTLEPNDWMGKILRWTCRKLKINAKFDEPNLPLSGPEIELAQTIITSIVNTRGLK